MPSVRDILSVKGNLIHSIDPTETVLAATHRMNEHKLGALVIMQNGSVAGIFTERDLLRRVVAEMRNPAETTVGEVMTTEVICVGPEMDIDDVSAILKQTRVRHLPVCDGDGQIVGLISIGDVNAMHASSQESTIEFLNEYIYGRV